MGKYCSSLQYSSRLVESIPRHTEVLLVVAQDLTKTVYGGLYLEGKNHKLSHPKLGSFFSYRIIHVLALHNHRMLLNNRKISQKTVQTNSMQMQFGKHPRPSNVFTVPLVINRKRYGFELHLGVHMVVVVMMFLMAC